MKRNFKLLPMILILSVLFTSCAKAKEATPSTDTPKVISSIAIEEPQSSDVSSDVEEPSFDDNLEEDSQKRLPPEPPPASISRIFPDPYLAERVAQILEKNINDIVTAEELASYTGNLDCPPGELSDLSGIGYLTGLKSLNCTKNEVKMIPAEIKNLVNLETLDFCKAYSLENIPAEIGTLKKLKVARFGLTSISCIPKEIGSLKNLQVLQLGANNIESVPKEIGNLKKLQYLDLHYNKISSIPDSICSLTDLRELELSHNEITKLPDSMGNLTKLATLNLFNNKIKYIPKTMKKLLYLNEMNVYDNFDLSESYKSFMPKLNKFDLNVKGNSNLLLELPAGLYERKSNIKYEFKAGDLFMDTYFDYVSISPQFSGDKKLILSKDLLSKPGFYEFRITVKNKNSSPEYDIYMWKISVE